MPEELIIAETNRLLIKSWTMADIEAFMKMCQMPGLSDFASSTYKDVNREKAIAFIEKESIRFLNSRSGKFAVHSKEEAGIIGVAGIFEMDDPYHGRFEINYRFPSKYWGKGIGVEAATAMVRYGFDKLNLDQVSAIILTANARSQRILEKLKMSLEHELEWHDSPAQLWSVRKDNFSDEMPGRNINPNSDAERFR